MSAHARPLAVWLADQSDDELIALFAARGIRTDANWQDFFDAAEGLLDQTAVEKFLPRLSADEARELWTSVHRDTAAAPGSRLVSLALVRPDGTPHDTVHNVVAALPEPPQRAEAPDQKPASAQAQAIAAERALTTVTALANVLLLSTDTPLALLGHGGLAATEKKRLAELGIDDADDLLSLGEEAQLLSRSERRLRLRTRAFDWLILSAAERWAVLANGFRDALPKGLRAANGGWISESAWESAYPWASDWKDRTQELHRHMHLLGLRTADGTRPEWTNALRSGHDADPGALAALLPVEVDRLFLQNDLSAIAPGPLLPTLDVRLRTMAARESTAQASSYRFTADSIAHALVRGETAESIRAFLTEISLTGVPQPLDYLINETAQRHGLVQVRHHREGTIVSSTDRHLLDAMSVDQALRPLGLTRDGERLISRVNAETISWALVDASYPATLVDDRGMPVQRDRHETAHEPEEPSYLPLIAQLRSRQGPDTDASWLDRELEAAVRTKATVTVEIGLPDGSLREFLLEARGLSGGRLRGRDRAADVERTLPLSSIRSVRVNDDA